MNTNNNNAMNNNNVSVSMLENLDLHIPKISANTTAKHIADALWYMRIATVDYVDIVAIKDPETKVVKHYSAFLRLKSWGPERFPAADFNERKSFKIVLGGYANDPYEKYWVLYPNTNPLPRSKVNTHQLAASTEKLFEINEQLVAKIAFMEQKFELMQKQIGIMEQVITRLTYVEPTPEEMKELIKIPELVREPVNELKRQKSCVIHFDHLPPLQKTLVVDADDCMFSRKLKPFESDELVADVPSTAVHILEQEPVDEAEVRVLIASNGRAVCSRDFCGNL